MTDPELIEKNLALGEHVKKGEFTFPLIPCIIVMHAGLIEQFLFLIPTCLASPVLYLK